MSAMSNYLETALVNATLRNTSFTSPTTVYVGLYTTSPGEGNTGTEVSGGSYARQSAAFAAPTDGVTTNSATLTFPTATGSWGTITHIGILDALTTGNLLYYAALDVSKTIGSGDIFTISSGNLSVTLA